MLQQFFTDTIESKFVKALLNNIELPLLPTITVGEKIIEGCLYIFNNAIIKCTKSGILTGISSPLPGNQLSQVQNVSLWDNVASWDKVENATNYDGTFGNATNSGTPIPSVDVGEYNIIRIYNFGTKVINLTETHPSTFNYYDSDTHYFLGQYLRCIRDIYHIDLMPFYNCFNYKIISDMYLTESTESCNYCTISDEDYRNDIQQKYKIIGIPIKFDKVYTIAVDCGTQLTLKSVFYGELGTLKASTTSGFVGELSDTLIENGGSYSITRGSSSFRSPFTYSISSSSHNNRITDTVAKMYERNLYLIIQLPASNVSSVVVLEGDYTNSSKKIYNAEYAEYIDDNQFNKLLLSPLQLLQFNDGNNYAFSNRLIEYLLDNVITSADTIVENIERTQLYASDLSKFAPTISSNSSYTVVTKGVWDNALRSFIFNNYTNTRNKNIDINGFVDKDVEKYITRGRVV